jgi:natural product precursor
MNNLKLNKLEEQNLAERQMNVVKGGGNPGNCGCACTYANNGGSSTCDNAAANWNAGLASPGSKRCGNLNLNNFLFMIGC